MAWQELLSHWQGSNPEAPEAVLARLIAKLDELLSTLEASEVAEKEKTSQGLIRVEWRAHALSLQPLEELERRLSRKERDRVKSIRRKLEAALTELSTGARESKAEELHEARETILGARRELELFAAARREEGRRSRLWRGAVMLAPVLIGGASIYYLRADRGLRLEQIEVMAPSAAYAPLSKDSAALTPRAEYLSDFMSEFSKYYFGHPSQFESLYYDTSDDSKDNGKDAKNGKDAAPAPASNRHRTLRHKIGLRNASQGQVLYLSSIEAVVDVVEKAEFPWTRLTVTPHVTAALDTPSHHRSLYIKSDGIGPALDVAATLTTQSGIILCKAQPAIFHRSRIEMFSNLVADFIEVSGADGALAAPRYYRMDAPPEKPGPQYFEVKSPKPGQPSTVKHCTPNNNPADDGWWEDVRFLGRLRKLVPTAYAEPYTLEVRYNSLKGTRESLHFGGTLEGTEAFYNRSDRLRATDPRCVIPPDHDSDSVIDSLAFEKLAFVFAPDKDLTHPKGVDLITARLGIELQDQGIGRRLATTYPLDGFLNPQGVLSISLSLHMPQLARYSVRILVNGSPMARYRFDGLVPEFMTFVEEGDDKAVARLRKLFEAEMKRGK